MSRTVAEAIDWLQVQSWHRVQADDARPRMIVSRQGRIHRPALLRQHRLRRPVGFLLCLAAPVAEARLSRPLRHARGAQGRGTGRYAVSPRQQGEGRSVLPRRHDAGDAPPRRAGAPGLSGHHLLCLQAGRERQRRRHRQHRLGDLSRRSNPAGFAISGTWPMRTELSNRMIEIGYERPRLQHRPRLPPTRG